MPVCHKSRSGDHYCSNLHIFKTTVRPQVILKILRKLIKTALKCNKARRAKHCKF